MAEVISMQSVACTHSVTHVTGGQLAEGSWHSPPAGSYSSAAAACMRSQRCETRGSVPGNGPGVTAGREGRGRARRARLLRRFWVGLCDVSASAYDGDDARLTRD